MCNQPIIKSIVTNFIIVLIINGLINLKPSIASEQFTTFSPPKKGIISANRVNVRSKPNSNAQIIAVIVDEGTEVELLGKMGQWFQIKAVLGDAWIHEGFISIAPQSSHFGIESQVHSPKASGVEQLTSSSGLSEKTLHNSTPQSSSEQNYYQNNKTQSLHQPTNEKQLSDGYLQSDHSIQNSNTYVSNANESLVSQPFAPKHQELDQPLEEPDSSIAGLLRVSYHHFINDMSYDPNSDDRVSYFVKLNSYFKTDLFKLVANGWIEAGHERNTYAGIFRWIRDPDHRRRYVELNEIFFKLNQPDFDLIIGKKILSNKVTHLFSPSDIFVPKELNDPLNPKELGIFQVQMNYSINQFKLTGALLPMVHPSKYPHELSRWRGNVGETIRDYEFYNEPYGALGTDHSALDFDHIGWFTKFSSEFQNQGNFFVSLYYGPDPKYLILKRSIENQSFVLAKQIVKGFNLSTGVSFPINNLTLGGDFTYHYSNHGMDDDYLSTTVEVTQTIDQLPESIPLQKLSFSAAYAYEFKLRHQREPLYIVSSDQFREGKNSIRAQLTCHYNDNLSFQYFTELELNFEGWLNRLETQYKIIDELSIKFALESIDGHYDSYLGRWDQNDRILMNLEYTF